MTGTPAAASCLATASPTIPAPTMPTGFAVPPVPCPALFGVMAPVVPPDLAAITRTSRRCLDPGVEAEPGAPCSLKADPDSAHPRPLGGGAGSKDVSRPKEIRLNYETRSAHLGLHVGWWRARAQRQARPDRTARRGSRRRPDQRHGPRLADRPHRPA